MERYPTPTKYLNEKRAALKWAEFASGGAFPGTIVSDVMVDMDKASKIAADKYDETKRAWQSLIDYLGHFHY